MTSPRWWLRWVMPVALLFGQGCGGAADSRPPTWSYVSAAIMEPNCATASCHSRSIAAAGLDFSDPERGYISLSGLWVWIVDPNGTVDRGCRIVDGTTVCQREHRSLVVPSDPAQSRLIQMLRARAGSLMPPDRALPEVGHPFDRKLDPQRSRR